MQKQYEISNGLEIFSSVFNEVTGLDAKMSEVFLLIGESENKMNQTVRIYFQSRLGHRDSVKTLTSVAKPDFTVDLYEIKLTARMNIYDHKFNSESWTPKHLERADKGITKLHHPFLPQKKIVDIFHFNGHYLTVYSDGSL